MALTKGFKKFVGLIGTVVVVAGVAVAFHKGLFNIHKSDTQDASVPTFQSSAPTASVAPQASVMPSNFKASADSLASITQNCVVRISVENPSEPIYGETGGMPHGFNYDFAKLLFAQPEFAQKCPNGVAIDTKHEVDTYENVPRQLLLTQNGATTVDIAMDGLTYSDNSPAQASCTRRHT
jgi:hypothetical protein